MEPSEHLEDRVPRVPWRGGPALSVYEEREFELERDS